MDEQSCEKRARDTPDYVTYVSSLNVTRELQGANLLSADPLVNPTAFDHHHIFGQREAHKEQR